METIFMFFFMFLIFLVLVVGVYVIIEYNRLIRTRNKVKEAFSSIDVYLEQRFDNPPMLA